VVGNHGSVVKSDFYTKLKKLDIQEGKKDKLFAGHVKQICEAINRVIVSFLQQVQGGTRPTTEGSRDKTYPQKSSTRTWKDLIYTSNRQGCAQIAQLSQKKEEQPTYQNPPHTSMYLRLGRKTYLQ